MMSVSAVIPFSRLAVVVNPTARDQLNRENEFPLVTYSRLASISEVSSEMDSVQLPSRQPAYYSPHQTTQRALSTSYYT